MKNRGFFPFFVQFVVCTRLSQSVTASQKHLKSSSSRKKPYYCCEIRRFSQRKVDLVLVAALPTRRERKMPNDSTAQKSKNQKNSGSTTGSAGANKDGPTHKICDENPSPRPSKSSEEGMAGKSASNEGSELLKFGSMLAASITELKDTMAGKFDQLEEILTQPDIWVQDTEERDDASEDDGDIDNSGGTTDEPPSKKSKLTSSSEVASKQTVLNSIAEKMQMQEKVDPGINEQLAKMINQLMFKKEKPDEEKLKEKLSHLIRPANCDSLVTTKVDELIWQRLRPQTRSFDSRAQVAQSCIVKSVTILSKMLDKALNLKDKLPDLTKSPDSNLDDLQTELDTLINDGMEAIETMSFASYEVNARRRECIKPDLNEDYMSLFSPSVPINQFLFGGDTSKRLEEIEKTNKVVRKAMVQQSPYPRQHHYKSGGSNKFRGRGPRPQTQRQGFAQRPFLGKRSSPYGNPYQKPQKGGGKRKETKP